MSRHLIPGPIFRILADQHQQSMSDYAADNDQRKQVDRVIDHIINNLDGPISLGKLAGVANYSPFHLQKVFKQIVGDSPKQYIIKLRLETAFHHLVIHPQKSIQEISIECGFSSPSVFSRAIKGQFGRSPGQIRELPHGERMKLLRSAFTKSFTDQTPTTNNSPQPGKAAIQVFKRRSVKGIYLMAPFDDPGEIQRAFRELTKIASSHEWLKPESRMYGILGPHQRNLYQAFFPVDQDSPGTDKFTITEIKGGNFASFKVRGNLRQTNKAAHLFYHKWLPDSGYKIAGVTGFEIFTENSAFTPYYQLEREIHIPIEPAL